MKDIYVRKGRISARFKINNQLERVRETEQERRQSEIGRKKQTDKQTSSQRRGMIQKENENFLFS